MNYNYDIFLNKQKYDPFKGVGRSYAPQFYQTALESPKQSFFTKPQQIQRTQAKQAYPSANLKTMTNYVAIVSSPDEAINDCAEFLTELNMTNFEIDLPAGNIKGYFFQDAKNVKYSIQIRGEDDMFVDATRMTGDAFVFADFWKALSMYLGEKGHAEDDSHSQEEEDSWDFIDFSDEEDMDIDMEDVKFLKFNECSDTLKYMIDDMKDPNFRETCASTLAFNCSDNNNKQIMMQYGQELFDALIACIFCSMATCYFAQLPFYRSAALLLDAVFENQAVQMVSVEQYETLVAATKNWALQSQNNQGEITCSEEIATILAKQLARCAPPMLTEKAQSDLFEMKNSPFHSVQQHAQAALSLVQ